MGKSKKQWKNTCFLHGFLCKIPVYSSPKGSELLEHPLLQNILKKNLGTGFRITFGLPLASCPCLWWIRFPPRAPPLPYVFSDCQPFLFRKNLSLLFKSFSWNSLDIYSNIETFPVFIVNLQPCKWKCFYLLPLTLTYIIHWQLLRYHKNGTLFIKTSIFQ